MIEGKEYVWDLEEMMFSMSAMETVIEKAGNRPIIMKNVDKHLLLDLSLYVATYYQLGETQKDIKEIKEMITKLGGNK